MLGVVIISGGMDSVTLAYHLKDHYPKHDFHYLSFDYGQRHVKELEFAGQCARDLGARWDVINLAEVGLLFAGNGSQSSLINNSVDVPHGHYEAETMKATVVPNRNMIMLSIAAGLAVAEKADFVAAGMHSGDHAIYPDCRWEFLSVLDHAINLGNEGFCQPEFGLHAPFVNMTKADIASLGDDLGVDWTKTWSCYEGGELHCGKCGTCTERREAFSLAGIVDPTEYA